jgi:ribosomal protein S18 acetylase RimI-like enzyme
MKIGRIKRFNERVFEAVLRLLPQLDPDAVLPDKEYFESILASENIHFFTGELDDNRIVAMLTIGTYNTPSGKKVWIEDVIVDESQRGKGFGEEFMLFAIGYSKTLGTASVSLTSRPSRIAANRLYKKLGFIQYETNVYKYLLK